MDGRTNSYVRDKTTPRLPNRGTTKPMFKCPYPTCGKKYHRSDKLKKHELIQHQNLDTPFRCSTCQRNFLTANDLKNHEYDVHTGSKLCCTRCGKSFRNESDLQVHISCYSCVFHNQVTKAPKGSPKIFRCHKCGEKFSNSDEWKKHGETHKSPKRAEATLNKTATFQKSPPLETLEGHLELTQYPSRDLNSPRCCFGNYKETRPPLCRVCRTLQEDTVKND